MPCSSRGPRRRPRSSPPSDRGAPCGARSVAGWPLERDIVVQIVDVLLRRRTRAFGAAARFRASWTLCGLGRRARAAAFATAEHLHAIGDDLRRVAVLAFLILPFARLQPTLDVNLSSFFQV